MIPKLESYEGKAGPRHEKFARVCELVEDNSDLFTKQEVGYASVTLSKLKDYGPQAFMSTGQISFVNALEQKCRDKGLLND